MPRIYSREEFGLLQRSMERMLQPTRASAPQVAAVKAALAATMEETFPRTRQWVQGTARPQSTQDLLFELYESFVRNAENSGLTRAQVGEAARALQASDEELFRPGESAERAELRNGFESLHRKALEISRSLTEKKGNFRSAALRQMEEALEQLGQAAQVLRTPEGLAALAEEFEFAVQTLRGMGVAAVAGAHGLRLSASQEAELKPQFEDYVNRYEAHLADVIRFIQKDEPVDLRGLVSALREDEGIRVAEGRLAVERAGEGR